MTLRRGTVSCQIVLFVAVRFLLATEVPFLVLELIAFEVASNLIFIWLIGEKKTIPVSVVTGVMFLDITLLTALLALADVDEILLVFSKDDDLTILADQQELTPPTLALEEWGHI